MSDRIAVRNVRKCEKDCLCLYVCPTGASDTENSVIDAEKCPARPEPSAWCRRSTRRSRKRRKR